MDALAEAFISTPSDAIHREVAAWEDKSLSRQERRAHLNSAIADIDLQIANLQRRKQRLRNVKTAGLE